MAATVSNLSYPVEKIINNTIAFDNSYPTGGEAITAKQLGLASITRVVPRPSGATAGGAGFVFFPTIASDGLSVNIEVFAAGADAGTIGNTTATNNTSAVTGTAAAQAFTPAATAGDLNLATPAFSGTGLTAAGQVITTTDNQTMTLNQCAGMWLISATGATPPNLILSNTAVTGAPAVLTVQGSANTDAGAYKIVRVNTAGTNAASASLTATAAAQVQVAHTHTFTGTGISALAEVANGTNLSALTAVPFTFYGFV